MKYSIIKGRDFGEDWEVTWGHQSSNYDEVSDTEPISNQEIGDFLAECVEFDNRHHLSGFCHEPPRLLERNVGNEGARKVLDAIVERGGLYE
jgi:hypothetical protein